MKQVWKFVPQLADISEIAMPAGAQILTVAAQHGNITLWALVDPLAPPESRIFRIAGTGHAIDAAECGHYLGTAILADGALVFHVFEIKESEV